MTSPNLNAPIYCYDCSARSWLTRTEGKSDYYACPNGHTWSDIHRTYPCKRCGADKREHLALHSSVYGEILACPAGLPAIIYQDA